MADFIASYVPIFSAFVSVVAVLIAVRTSYKQSVLNLKIAQDEQKLIYQQIRLQRDSDIIQWADQCIDIVAEQESFLRCHTIDNLTDAREDRAYELLHQLSALIDRGRIFFPNDFIKGKGENNPRAYRGERQPILSHLVICYNLFQSSLTKSQHDRAKDIACKIHDFRRLFVSETQLAIDPHRYLQFFEMHDLREASGEFDPAKLSKMKSL